MQHTIGCVRCVVRLVALQELPTIQQQIEDSGSTFAVLETSHHLLLDDSADVFWQLRRWPTAIHDELAAARERVWGYRNRYQLQLQEDQRHLQQDLQQLQVRLGVVALTPFVTSPPSPQAT